MLRKTRKLIESGRRNIQQAIKPETKFKLISKQVRSTMFGGSFTNFTRFKLVQKALGHKYIYDTVKELVDNFLKTSVIDLP
jgi:hypothetical protein